MGFASPRARPVPRSSADDSAATRNLEEKIGVVWDHPHVRLGSLPLVALSVLLTSCSSGSAGHSLVGVVTTTKPRLCLGGPQASGDCFAATSKQVGALRAGQCLKITYAPLSGIGPRGRLLSVTLLRDAPSWCHL